MSGIPAGGGAQSAADLLRLAAAPAFAIMALLTGRLGGGQMAMTCGTPEGASLLGGMVPMYLLMSAVHAAPWLKLVAGRRRGVRRPRPIIHERRI